MRSTWGPSKAYILQTMEGQSHVHSGLWHVVLRNTVILNMSEFPTVWMRFKFLTFLKKKREYCITHFPVLRPLWFPRIAYFILGTGCNPSPKQQRRWLTLIKTQNKKRFCGMSGAYGLEELMLNVCIMWKNVWRFWKTPVGKLQCELLWFSSKAVSSIGKS